MIKPRHVSHVEEDRLARTVCVENPEGTEQGRRLSYVCARREEEWKKRCVIILDCSLNQPKATQSAGDRTRTEVPKL